MTTNELLELIAPKKDMVFFTPKGGITMSEANHLANQIKESTREYLTKIGATKAASTAIMVGEQFVAIQKPVKADFSKLGAIGAQFGFSAWLREAIKAKDVVNSYLSVAQAKDLLQEDEPVFTSRELKSSRYLGAPNKVDESDAISAFSITERAEYFLLEAVAAHIGKAIHQDGSLAKLREDLMTLSEVSLYRYNNAEVPAMNTAVYNAAEIDTIYFELQAQHRATEAKLNSYKARIKNWVTETNQKLSGEFAKASKEASDEVEAHNAEVRAENQKNNALVRDFNNRANTTRLELTRLFSGYRIVVPDIFADLHKSLSN